MRSTVDLWQELASLLDAIPMPAGVVDRAGTLCAANVGWAQANTPLAALQPTPGPGYVERLKVADADGAAALWQTIEATLNDGPVDERPASRIALTACVELTTSTPGDHGSAWVTRVAPAGANIVLVTHEDVSKRQRVQADLHKSRARLRTILTGAPLALFAVDNEGRLSLVEGMAAGAAGLITPEMVGRRVEDEYRHIPDLVATVHAALGGSTAVTTLEVGALAFEVHCSPEFSSAGQQRGAVGIATDVSERVRAQRLKDDFVSVVNHELRTPLTSIHGALSLLENNVAGQLPEDAVELTKIARTSVDRLIRMITDLLDLDRLDSGRFELSCAIVDVAEIVAEAARELDALARDAEVDIKVRVPTGAMVDADKDRIHQVVTNLLSNAIKFSPAGSEITIDARASGAYVRVSVADHGPGIMPEDRARLFCKFSQLAAPGGSNRRGSGLGLVISKSIVEAHGGRISLHSEVGVGSTFFFELRSASPVRPASNSTSRRG